MKEMAERMSEAFTTNIATSQSLAEAASEQAASLEETSSSLEEMSSMTKQNADHANEAGQRTDARCEQFGETGYGYHEPQMNSAMEETTRASEETAKIIKTIDEIRISDQPAGAQRGRGSGQGRRGRSRFRRGGRRSAKSGHAGCGSGQEHAPA